MLVDRDAEYLLEVNRILEKLYGVTSDDIGGEIIRLGYCHNQSYQEIVDHIAIKYELEPLKEGITNVRAC